MPLPPASAAIFTSYLYHSLSVGSPNGSPNRNIHRQGIQRQPRASTEPPTSIIDVRIAAICDAPLAPGESPHFGATRKMTELIAFLATLTVAQSRTLHARLWHPKSADPLLDKLAKLGTAYKQRLILFLGRHRVIR